MIRLIAIVCFLPFTLLKGQSQLDELFAKIETNNKSLKTLRLQLDAQKVQNRVGLNPENPQMQYVHQWGKTDQMGTRQEFNVTQGFDFPTAYIHRNRMYRTLDEKAEREYLAAYNQVMLQAVSLVYQIVYRNALAAEYQIRLDHAESISEAYHSKLESGDINIMKRNKADLNLLKSRNDLRNLNADKEALLERLKGINGGNVVALDLIAISINNLPIDFDAWYKEQLPLMPRLAGLESALEANRQKEQLNRALSLPKLSAGYSSEKGITDDFKGVNVGLSIPLWENKNSVKQVQLNSLAMENNIADHQLQAYHGLKALYTKATQLRLMLDDYNTALNSLSNTGLLKTALTSGEISILEYMVELGIYYEAIEKYISLQMEYQTTVARLNYFDVN